MESQVKNSEIGEVTQKKVIVKVNVAGDPFMSMVLDKKARVSIAPDVFKNIGSEYIAGTENIIRGLPPLLEEALMPTYKGISRNTDNYDKIIKDFWAEFTVKVKADVPLILDMSTRKEERIVGGKAMILDIPINLDQYMKGYFCMQSSQVAKTADERSNIGFYSHTLEDVSEAKKAEVSEVNYRTKAMKYYIDIVENTKGGKIDEVLQLLRGRVGLDITSTMSVEDKKIQLSKVLELYPEDLIRLAEDKNLTLKAIVRKALDEGILQKEGDTYFLQGDEVPLARGVKEMLAVFTDPNKTKQVAIIKARLETT